MDHTISLATADRSRSLGFYVDGLGLEAFGPLADDGVPEPLQFRLASNVTLMLIPTGGFGWVAGEDRVARQAPTSLCSPPTPLTRTPCKRATRPSSPPAEPPSTSPRSGSGAPSLPKSPNPTGTSG
jgi:hypothetical protein